MAPRQHGNVQAIPRYGETVRRKIRYVERHGAYALAVCGGLVLLTHQREPIPEFQLPGGGIDPGESPLAALYRESLEETGWHLRAIRRFAVYRRFTYMPEYDLWARKTHRIYLCTATLRAGKPSERFHTAHWVDAGTAMNVLASVGDRAILRQAVEGGLFSDLPYSRFAGCSRVRPGSGAIARECTRK